MNPEITDFNDRTLRGLLFPSFIH